MNGKLLATQDDHPPIFEARDGERIQYVSHDFVVGVGHANLRPGIYPLFTFGPLPTDSAIVDALAKSPIGVLAGARDTIWAHSHG